MKNELVLDATYLILLNITWSTHFVNSIYNFLIIKFTIFSYTLVKNSFCANFALNRVLLFVQKRWRPRKRWKKFHKIVSMILRAVSARFFASVSNNGRNLNSALHSIVKTAVSWLNSNRRTSRKSAKDAIVSWRYYGVRNLRFTYLHGSTSAFHGKIRE